MEIKPASVNAVNTNKKMPGTRGDQEKKECFACEYFGHFARDRQCPAKEKQNVTSAEKWGILSQDALSQRNKATKNGSRNVGVEPGEAGLEVVETHGEEINVANVDTHEDNPYDENWESGREPGAAGNGYAFTVTGVNNEKGTCTLIVGGIDLTEILIDSGAGKNVIVQETWEYLKNQGYNVSQGKQHQFYLLMARIS